MPADRVPLQSTLLGMVFAFAVFVTGGQAQVYSVIHNFAGAPNDGAFPSTNLTLDDGGNVYGTTEGGGASDNGTVFKIDPDGTETVLYSFVGGQKGSGPSYGLVLDKKKGDFYGTAGGNNCGTNCGIIWKLTAKGRYRVMHTFDGTDGSLPNGIIIDAIGNLYGTAAYGGNSPNCPDDGCGVIWKLAADGSFSVLHNFTGSPDGATPSGRLNLDSANNLYGDTEYGGFTSLSGGYGTVYKVAPSGAETVLYSFTGGDDGYDPSSGIVRDKVGNIYGTTSTQFDDTVFKLTPDRQLITLHVFTGEEGRYPEGGLWRTASGRLYGTANNGGPYNYGTIFRLNPDGTMVLLHSFDGADGDLPSTGLVRNKHIFYGTTELGGANDFGVVFGLRNK